MSDDDWRKTTSSETLKLIARMRATSLDLKTCADVLEEYAREEHLLQNSCIKLGNLLRGTVNVLRGPPPELMSWSTHDVVELAQKAVDRAQARWIACEERMPLSGARVLALRCMTRADSAVVKTMLWARWTSEYEHWSDGVTMFPRHEVTHWQPIPELPR